MLTVGMGMDSGWEKYMVSELVRKCPRWREAVFRRVDGRAPLGCKLKRYWYGDWEGIGLRHGEGISMGHGEGIGLGYGEGIGMGRALAWGGRWHGV